MNTSKTLSIPGGDVDSKTMEVTPGTDEHQRATWSTLQTNLHELISNLTTENLVETLPKVFSLNLIRGRGHFVNEMLKTQMARKGKEVDGAAKLFASLTSVINTKLPQVGKLLVKRTLFEFRRYYKTRSINCAIKRLIFLSHLVNQQLCKETLAIQLANFLIARKSSDSVSCLDVLLCRTGKFLEQQSPKAANNIFESIRIMLQEGTVDRKSQKKIEKLIKTRRKGYFWYKTVDDGLDLVEKADRITHDVQLNGKIDIEAGLDQYTYDTKFFAE